jgi:hypothetical protein
MAELSVHDTSPFAVEIAITKLKKYKLPGSYQIPAEDKTLQSEIHKLLILFGLSKNYPTNERSLLLNQFTKRVIKLTVGIIVGYHSYQLRTKLYPISLKVKSIYK